MLRIYTDGSCEGNPGNGGWAALIVGDAAPKVISGCEGRTTNNRMEQTAAIKGLEAIPRGTQVTVFSDSRYLVATMTRGWKRRANQDLWGSLDELAASRRVRWKEVRAHSGHPENEFVNALAQWEAGVIREKPVLEHYVASGAKAHDAAEAPPPSGEARLTHLDEQGRARMVEVGAKPETAREAVARGSIVMRPETLDLIRRGGVEKGDVLATARLAGVMGAKQTPQLIPLCHPIPLTHVDVEFAFDESRSAIDITATARAVARTGVEMEALTAVTVAALTVYDMAKAADRGMRVEGVRLVRKSGGRSGDIVLE